MSAIKYIQFHLVCLARWRREVNSNENEIKFSIDRVLSFECVKSVDETVAESNFLTGKFEAN